MTVIRPNSVSGITSITAQANEINFFRSNGTLAGLQLNGVNFNTTTGISTLAALKITGNLDVAGVLTYQDVTNVDSVGIITARSTIDAQGSINLADSIIHTGDTDTKIRFPAANTVTVEAGGHERLRIYQSKILKGLTSARGNYGNNTSGVEYGVQIEGTSAITAGLSIVRNSNDANDGGIVLGKTRATSTGGNTVVQAGDDLGNLTFAGNDGSTMLFGAEIFAEVQSGVGNDDMPADLIFNTNSGTTSTSERLRITSDGNIGVAGDTGTDFNLLDGMVINTGNGSAGLMLNSSSSSHNAYLSFSYGSGSSTSHADQFSAYIGRVGDNTLILGTNNTIRAQVDSSGNFNIGANASSNPFNYLRFGASQYGAADIRPTNEASHKVGLAFYVDGTQDTTINPVERLRIATNGNIYTNGNTSLPTGSTSGFGFSQDQFYISYTGTSANYIQRFYNANGLIGSILANGSGVAYNTSSDYRLKENEVAISDGITRLKTLKPYRFNFKTDPSKTVDGFFAHEVTAVPEAIAGEKDGAEMQGIDHSKLVPLLTAALQEEIAKREALEARIAALEGS